MTGRELVSSALRLIGAVAPGESPAASEASDGLLSINRMIDGWSNEGLLINAITKEAPITLVAGDSEYTLGTGGDIAIRPMQIKSALIRDSSGVEYPMRLLTQDEYADITLKTIQTTLPEGLWDDGGYPVRTLRLYPVPSAAFSLILYTLRPLTRIATLDTEISLPPGYEEAIIYNAAIRLAPEYRRQVSQEVAMIAIESKDKLKRSNFRPSLLLCDSALLNRNEFDIDTGRFE